MLEKLNASLEFQYSKQSHGLFAGMTTAKPFTLEAMLNQCLLIIPLSKSKLSVRGNTAEQESAYLPFSLTFIPAAQHLQVKQESDTEHLFMVLDREYLKKHKLDYLCARAEGVPPVVGYCAPDISLIAQALRLHLPMRDVLAPFFIETLANLLIIHVVAACNERGDMNLNAVQLRESLMRKSLKHIEDSLADGISVAELAKLSNMPLCTFTRNFRACFGQSPNQYIIERRINRARHLLLRGDRSLAEVAYLSGFSSQSHMTDTFREKLGVTPGRLRREMKNRKRV